MLSHRCFLLQSYRPSLYLAAKATMGRTKGQGQGRGGGAQSVSRHATTQAQPQQKQKQKKSVGGLQHYNSFLQFLVLDIDHTSPSVLLFFNKERYLFNAGEGIQRLFREHRIRISQLDAYLVTRVSTETLGGLPGMALAISPPEGSGLLEKQAVCTVKGPRGLSSYVAAFRGYVNHENHVAVQEFDEGTSEPIVRTDVVSITPIVVRLWAGAAGDSGTAAAAAANGSGNGQAADADNGPAAKRQRTEGPSAQQSMEDGEGRQRPAPPPGSGCDEVVVYAVQLAGRPGKFDPEKAKELGVTPGPAFGKLQRGAPVTTDSGRVVQPLEVMEPASPGPCLLLLDTPSREALEAVAASDRVRKFVAEAVSTNASADSSVSSLISGERLCVAVHLSSPAVAADTAALDAWRADVLGPAWRHVLVTPGSQQPSSIPRATVFQARLNAVNPTCFPLFEMENVAAPPSLPEAELESRALREAAAKEVLKGRGVEAGGGGSGAAAAAGTGQGGEAEQGGEAGAPVGQQPPVLPLPPAGSATGVLSAVRLNLMPPNRRGLQYGDVFKYDSASKVQDEMRSDAAFAEVLTAATEVQQLASQGVAPEGAGPVPPVADRRQVELTFLGTASSQPSKYRNVSGTYVDLFDRGGLLVDVGEDAMGQMKRRFGPAEAERRLGEGLGLVWVSHMHADHHGGLYRLLEWRARQGLPPLLVVGPTKLFDILLRYSAAIPIQFIFLKNVALSRPDNSRPPLPVVMSALAAARQRLGLAGFWPFPVEHIYDSHGLRLDGQAGWSLVFSGDTRPCEQTVAAARGATLLVHEATFEERMREEAQAKKHSTTAEAVAVGERAGAYRTILTHFSTRYPTLPELDLGPHPGVAVAMDLMSINLADLPWLPRLVRPMGLLFKVLEKDKDVEDDEEQ